ncbi:M23 family metallopeptidase [Aquincola sp. S2]|uniref:M23 family metallopeptidase n=1 Tax=Pseudaquabacterium terrae TaxID=2732868 RepID=A0ABX2EA95_9BURK|nr:M23 family metallopeptidase [Aquabacterium terrae]NRF65753.1 M23 family metallopeptidase [Aquabacterium terrae]
MVARRAVRTVAWCAVIAGSVTIGCSDEAVRERAGRHAAPAAPSAPVAPSAPAAAAAASASAPAVLAGIHPPSPGSLRVPVAGIDASMLRDNYEQARGAQRHEALDIPAPRGTPVVAAADGRVVKLFNSKPGGLTVYQFDPTERYAYYYAHLDRYADGLKEGAWLKRGDPVGTVGSTGNASADAPHLHFAVFVLGAERQWWKGTPLNPYPLIVGQR